MRTAGRDRFRRLLWVTSLVVALAAGTWALLSRGAHWGIGAAP